MRGRLCGVNALHARTLHVDCKPLCAGPAAALPQTSRRGLRLAGLSCHHWQQINCCVECATLEEWIACVADRHGMACYVPAACSHQCSTQFTSARTCSHANQAWWTAKYPAKNAPQAAGRSAPGGEQACRARQRTSQAACCQCRGLAMARQSLRGHTQHAPSPLCPTALTAGPHVHLPAPPLMALVC